MDHLSAPSSVLRIDEAEALRRTIVDGLRALHSMGAGFAPLAKLTDAQLVAVVERDPAQEVDVTTRQVWQEGIKLGMMAANDEAGDAVAGFRRRSRALRSRVHRALLLGFAVIAEDDIAGPIAEAVGVEPAPAAVERCCTELLGAEPDPDLRTTASDAFRTGRRLRRQQVLEDVEHRRLGLDEVAAYLDAWSGPPLRDHRALRASAERVAVQRGEAVLAIHARELLSARKEVVGRALARHADGGRIAVEIDGIRATAPARDVVRLLDGSIDRVEVRSEDAPVVVDGHGERATALTLAALGVSSDVAAPRGSQRSAPERIGVLGP